MKIANQPITGAVPVYPVTKRGHDWLLDGFLFGNETDKNHPVRYTKRQIHDYTNYKETRSSGEAANLVLRAEYSALPFKASFESHFKITSASKRLYVDKYEDFFFLKSSSDPLFLVRQNLDCLFPKSGISVIFCPLCLQLHCERLYLKIIWRQPA